MRQRSTPSPFSKKNKMTSVEMKPLTLAAGTDDDVDSIDMEMEIIRRRQILKRKTSDLLDFDINVDIFPYYKRRQERKKKIMRLITAVATAILLILIASFTIFHSKSHSGPKKQPKTPKHSDAKVPEHPSFGIMRSMFLDTHQAHIHVYKHKKTSAEFMAYIPNDVAQDKVFGISFRTKPTSSNGVAHILEHSVLSGSEKYKAKDPFVLLMKGSLNTYLNAMTYNDRTVYPVASRNRKDFFNLMSVYLDAVFAPRCITDEGSWVLKQEGWRYDTDADDNLEIKGVVYSEMKGVFSDPISFLNRNTDKFLYNNTYYYDSGGEPSEIPTLTQEEFVDFYHRHYHPTNSQSFVSGTVQDVMEAMHELDSYMSKYEYDLDIKKNSEIPFSVKYFEKPKSHTLQYPVKEVDDSKGQHIFQITWLLNDEHLPQSASLAFYILDYLLVGTASAPLYKRLSESGLGTEVTGNGLATGLLQYSFAMGLRGIKKSDVGKVENEIISILEDVANNGFSQDEIDAAMNSIEFDLREVHTGSSPMGISIFTTALTKWNYDLLPESAIMYDEALEEVKESVKQMGSRFFQKRIRDYLLTNNHRVHITLEPSDKLEAEMIQAEKEKNAQYQKSLTKNELDEIKNQAKALKKLQDTPDSPSIVKSIPSLTIADLDRTGVEYDIEELKNVFGSQLTLTKNVVDGNAGIFYIDIGIDISSLAYYNMELIPFVEEMLNEGDTKNMKRADIDNSIGKATGGIGISFELIPLYDKNVEDYRATNANKMKSVIFFRAKCTSNKTKETLDLIQELAKNSLPVDQKKAIEILERKIESFKSRVSSSGHSFASTRIHSRYDTITYLTEKLYGIEQLHSLESMLEKADKDWNSFRKRLEKVIASFSHMNPSTMVINVSGDLETITNSMDAVENFVHSLGRSESEVKDFFKMEHPWITKAKEAMKQITPQNEVISISSQVSYVGKGGTIFGPNEKISGTNCAPLEFLKKGYLWETVRAKNGAYGVMASLDKTDGFLGMVSYRDPQFVKTVEAYNDAGDYLNEQISKLSKDEIKTSIIGCINNLDGSALAPREAGWLSFLRHINGSTASRRQKWRDQILSTKKSDFQSFVKRLNEWKEKATLGSVASQSTIDDASNAGLSNMNVIEL